REILPALLDEDAVHPRIKGEAADDPNLWTASHQPSRAATKVVLNLSAFGLSERDLLVDGSTTENQFRKSLRGLGEQKPIGIVFLFLCPLTFVDLGTDLCRNRCPVLQLGLKSVFDRQIDRASGKSPV